MSGLLALALLTWEGAPRCDEPASDSAQVSQQIEEVPAPPWEPEERLQAATEAYLSGELDRARDAYVLLVGDPGLAASHPEVRREAQVYLAALDFNRGDLEAARATFLSILLEEAEFRLDPFAHPPDLLAFFDSVRVQAEAMRPPPPVLATRRLNPLLLVVPGGLQLYNDQQAYGLVVLGSVVGLAGVSGAMHLRLRAMDREPGLSVIEVHTEDDKRDAERFRTTNLVTGWGSVALWGLTFLHGALVSVRADGRATVSVVGPNVVVRW